MMKNETPNKLNKYLSAHETFCNEAQVMYILIETRKLIEHEDDNTKNRILKFYCDWVAHIKKDRVSSAMKDVVRDLYLSAKNQIEYPYSINNRSKTSDFAYMIDFGNETKLFYEQNRINTEFIDDNNKWNNFISILVKILENQPVNNPIKEVNKIIFLPAADNCVIFRIEFAEPIKGYSHYDYMNAY